LTYGIALATPGGHDATVDREMTRRKSARAIIGVDVGGTHLSGGLVTPDGEVLGVLEHPTHEHGEGTAVEQMLGVIRALHAEARHRGIEVEGVGVGLPGIVDTDKGMMVGDVYLVPELEKLPIAERIREVTGLPVALDNDVNALGLAERRWGAGRGVRSLVLLALGSGPGGAVILNGELVRGRNGYGGEFGHVPIFPDGPRCLACSAPGCAAAHLGGELIARQARGAVRQHADSQILALAGGNVDAVTARTVFEAARMGDEIARVFVDRACEALAVVLGIVLNALNPDLVVVTGGMAPSLILLEGEILRRAARYVFPRVLADTTIRFVPSSKQDTVRGGAALFLYELERLAPRSPSRRS
jgi:glucokinase